MGDFIKRAISSFYREIFSADLKASETANFKEWRYASGHRIKA